MAIETGRQEPAVNPADEKVAAEVGASRDETTANRLTTDHVWQDIGKGSFAVVSYVTPKGYPRSSGVVYKSLGRRLYFVVAPDSWKARHIAVTGRVSVVVPVRRGGILSLLGPIPPATVSFHATAIVHPPGSIDLSSLSKELVSLLPHGRRDSGCVIELTPEGDFLTYGLGVSLMEMRRPEVATARLPAR
jgi:pyridoxamine 5'-phosphate oxidase-like protein